MASGSHFVPDAVLFHTRIGAAAPYVVIAHHHYPENGELLVTIYDRMFA